MKWLIPPFALGVVVGGLLFSAGNQDSSSAVELAAQPSPPTRPPIENHAPSQLPTVKRAVEVPRVKPPVSAVSLRPSATPRRASERTVVGAPPATQPVSVAARPAVANLPRYHGSLVIESNPPGALVSIDGRVIGSTPIVLDGLRAGSRVVRIASSGYEPWSTAARVVANEKTRVTATLQPRSKP